MEDTPNARQTSNPLKVKVPAQEGQVSMSFTRGGARMGAGRKPVGETRKVSITLTPELWQEIDRQCEQQGCSRSEWLRGMIEDAVAASSNEFTAPHPIPSPQQQKQQPPAAGQRFGQQQQQQ
ncbi:ribbon-helix-helix domain-containing protein [Paenibacillus kobensis]|uniref:ribbon-helix-helix domain-containing protein n=1 Tax=Paenibacillus kobensis TaxID=59841 RepID=UPI00158117AB|nr:ribbon-helix-helix domain-containing protein [Paenibacillus kobensis]